jgi:hypothetical protein
VSACGKCDPASCCFAEPRPTPGGSVVPLLTLLSSEFPELRSALFAWVQPLVNAFVKQ